MNLKYVITSSEFDPEVLEDKGRGDDPIEQLLGLNWNLKTDTILAKPRYNYLVPLEEPYSVLIWKT